MVRFADARQLEILAPNGTLATTRRHIERDRAAVTRFMRAYLEGVHFLKTNRDDSIAIMQQHLGGLPVDDLAILYDDVREQFQPVPAPREDAMAAVLAREPEAVARDYKPSDILDLSFLREIEQSGFVAALYK